MIVLIYARFISARAFIKGQPLKLHCQRATNVLPSRVCYLAHLCQHLYSKRQLCKNHNLGTARSKMVLNGHDVVQQGEAAKFYVATSFPKVIQVCVGEARMPLLKLHCQCDTNVLPSCVCCLAHLGPHLYSKRQLQKDHDFGTATS